MVGRITRVGVAASMVVLIGASSACSTSGSNAVDAAASETSRSADWLDNASPVTAQLPESMLRTTDMSVMSQLTPAEQTVERLRAAAEAKAIADAEQAARDARLEAVLVAAAAEEEAARAAAEAERPVRPDIPTTTSTTTSTTSTTSTTTTTERLVAAQSITIPDEDDLDDPDDAPDPTSTTSSSTTTTGSTTTIAELAFEAPAEALDWRGQRFDLGVIETAERSEGGSILIGFTSHRVLAQPGDSESAVAAQDLSDEPVFTGQADGRWEPGSEAAKELRVARSAEVRVLYDAGNDRACSGRDDNPDFEAHTATDLLWLIRVGRDNPRNSLSSLAAVTFDDEGVISRLSLSRLC